MSSTVEHLVENARDRDPREDEDWFQRLPPAAQAQTRVAWSARFDGEQKRRAVFSARSRRAAFECGGLLAGVLAFVNFISLSFGALVLLVLGGYAAGAIAGIIIATLKSGRFQCSVIGALSFLVVQLALSPPSIGIMSLLFVFLGVWLASNLFAVYGIRREFRGAVGGEGN